MAAPFVLVLEDGTIAGYYTLSSTSVQISELPEQTVRKLPRYPLVPATLLGRLAVDRRQQGKGYGRFLLADALYRAAQSEIASFAVIVVGSLGNPLGTVLGGIVYGISYMFMQSYFSSWANLLPYLLLIAILLVRPSGLLGRQVRRA